MTELQKRPKYGPSWGLTDFTQQERDYYKARCAVAEEALNIAKCTCSPSPKAKWCSRCEALRIIAASETP